MVEPPAVTDQYGLRRRTWFYHKQHLVPFGETIPMIPSSWFESFLSHLGLSYHFVFWPGEHQKPFKFQGPLDGQSKKPFYIGSLVCFELIYPDLVKHYRQQGVDLIVNSNNLGWFHGNPLLAKQFLAIGQVRASEN